MFYHVFTIVTRCLTICYQWLTMYTTCLTSCTMFLNMFYQWFDDCWPCFSYMLTMCFVYVEPCFSYMLTMRQPEINYKKVGARTQHSLVRNRICLSTLRTCIPHRCGVIFESTLRTRDPHPSKSKLWTGLKQVELRPILKRIGTCCGFFRGGSEYGNPVAIWEMLHNSKITNLIGNNNKHQIKKTAITIIIVKLIISIILIIVAIILCVRGPGPLVYMFWLSY
jgi:Ca2+/Na+ antiporter